MLVVGSVEWQVAHSWRRRVRHRLRAVREVEVTDVALEHTARRLTERQRAAVVHLSEYDGVCRNLRKTLFNVFLGCNTPGGRRSPAARGRPRPRRRCRTCCS